MHSLQKKKQTKENIVRDPWFCVFFVSGPEKKRDRSDCTV